MLNKFCHVKKIMAATTLVVLAGCSSLSPVQQRQELNAKTPDQAFQFEDLPAGHQGDIGLDDRAFNLEAGKTFYRGFKFEPGHPVFYIQLRTYIQDTDQGDGFFYPVIEFYSFSKEKLNVMKPQLRFTQEGTEGRYAPVPLQINADVGFIVIRTQPKLYGQEASYSTKHAGASWSYSVSPFDKGKPAVYLPLGKVELLTPDEGYSIPFEKLTGMYWQFAIQQGGRKLAKTQEYLPDLTLAGGTSFSLGYAWPVYGRPFSTIRTQVGFGYYSVDDEDGANNTIKYGTADALWVESNRVTSLGIGLTSTYNHSWKKEGVTTHYDPTIGPKLILELRGAFGVTIGAQLSWQDYTDDNGDTQRNNQWGVYFTSFF